MRTPRRFLPIAPRHGWAWLLSTVILFTSSPASMAFAPEAADKPRFTPPPPAAVKVSTGPRSVRLFKPRLAFSQHPKDLELSMARVFPEPLAPMTSAAVPGENEALARALLAFKRKDNPEDLTDLTAFIVAFPHSRWRPALEVNIGLRRRECGYFSEALAPMPLT